MTVICIMILAYLIMGKDISGLLEKIKNEVYAFCNDDNQFDDMTMLIIRYNGCENNGK